MQKSGQMPAGYVQRGVVAIRAPDGEFMPSVPFYERKTEAIRKGEKTVVKDAADLFAEVLEADGKGG